MKQKKLPLLLVALVLVVSGLMGWLNEQEAPTPEPAAQTEATEATQAPQPEPAEAEETEDVTAEEPEPSQEETESQAETAQIPEQTEVPSPDETETAEELPESGEYTSKDDVARYIYLYGHLPDNFITKREAKKLGWVSSEGNLGQVAPGKSIGGDRFGNYEGLLPEAEGREYHECDIDSDGSYRGAKRIVFSNDGLIYYTEDHYEHFELLYGEE